MSKKSKKKRYILPLLILLILLLLFFWQYKLGQAQRDAEAQQQAELLQKQKLLDALNAQQALMDSIAKLRMQDSLLQNQIELERRRLDSLARLDSLRRLDSLARLEKNGSTNKLTNMVMTKSDSINPLLRVTPITGRYFETFTITPTCNEKKCTVYSSKDGAPFQPFTPAPTSQSTRIQFYAIDSAGNHSDTLIRKYEFEKKAPACPNDMSSIPIKGSKDTLCIDTYEWPNKKNEKPITFVSHSDAQHMCEEVGKRLCTKTEWQTACTGKYKTTFPYGNDYDQNSCETTSTKAARSGRNQECRSFYGPFDMSGNVWEWTATKHETRSSYYYVSGGNWSSQEASTCTEAKYSFFPQNQYQFVGFRCCK